MQIRLLPVLVLTALLLFSAKVAGIIEGTQNVPNIFLIDDLNAKTAEEPVNEESNAPSSKTGTADIERSPENQTENQTNDNNDTPSPSFSPEKVNLLTQLSQRREALDEREQSILLREATLKAAEARIDQKLAELRTLYTKTEAILADYNQQEDLKITRLVKIYEKMKPKDAAKIFEKMELGVLLEVVSSMKESRIAPIMAEMTTLSAKELTLALAKYRRIPKVKKQLGQ